MPNPFFVFNSSPFNNDADSYFLLGDIMEYDNIVDDFRNLMGINHATMATLVHRVPDEKCTLPVLLRVRFGELDPHQPTLRALVMNYQKSTRAFHQPGTPVVLASTPLPFVKDSGSAVEALSELMLLTHLSKSQLVWLFNSPVLDGHDFRSLGGLRAGLHCPVIPVRQDT